MEEYLAAHQRQENSSKPETKPRIRLSASTSPRICDALAPRAMRHRQFARASANSSQHQNSDVELAISNTSTTMPSASIRDCFMSPTRACCRRITTAPEPLSEFDIAHVIVMQCDSCRREPDPASRQGATCPRLAEMTDRATTCDRGESAAARVSTGQSVIVQRTEPARHDTDDIVRIAVQRDRTATNLRVAAELSRPKVVP